MSTTKRWHRYETKILQEIWDLVEIVKPDIQHTGKKTDPENELEEIYLINWAIDDPVREEKALTLWNQYLEKKKEGKEDETDVS